MNIKYVPTVQLIIYLNQWNLMYMAGIVATYSFTPPYTDQEIRDELKERGIQKGESNAN